MQTSSPMKGKYLRTHIFQMEAEKAWGYPQSQGVKLSVKDPPAVPELITFSLEQKVLRERKPLLRSLLGEHQVKDFKLLRNN